MPLIVEFSSLVLFVVFFSVGNCVCGGCARAGLLGGEIFLFETPREPLWTIFHVFHIMVPCENDQKPC